MNFHGEKWKVGDGIKYSNIEGSRTMSRILEGSRIKMTVNVIQLMYIYILIARYIVLTNFNNNFF